MRLNVSPYVPLACCVLGLLISAAALVPAWTRSSVLPIPLFVGAGIYLLSAFVMMAASTPEDRPRLQLWLRFVRLGFVVVFLFALLRLTPGS